MRKRTLAIVGVAAALALSLAACANNTDGTDPTTGNTGDTGTTNTGAPPAASAVTIRGCTPQELLITSNTNEVCGGNVLDAVTSKLVHYNSDDASPELDIAESIETDDAVLWTIKIKPGYKFQDGTEVTAKSFVDTWNWVVYGPNGQKNSYFFEPFKGYEEMQCGEAGCDAAPPAVDTLSGLTLVDDHTFTAEMSAPTSNLMVRLGYTVFAPQPQAFFDDTSEGHADFAKLPIGSGPYQMVENTDTQMVLEKFADYSGDFPGSVDKVSFVIYSELGSAYNDVVANNLDLTDVIPQDMLVDDLWKQDLVNADGSERWGTAVTGIIQSINFMPATVDPGLADIRIRQAISMSIDREGIAQQIYNGAREAATGWVPPMVDGFKPNACSHCNYDPAAAKELYDQTDGYPGTLQLWVNTDGGHLPWAEAACNSIKAALDLDCVAQTTTKFADLRTMIENGEVKGLTRAGWQMDYPSIENFLAPIYGTGAASNDSDYSSPVFDQLLVEAAAATDLDAANALYQQAEAQLDIDFPATPFLYQSSQFGFSNRIAEVKMTPFSTFDLGSIVMAG